MTTDKRGISALLLQRQLGLQRYETAWMMLHKLRRAMINLERESLRGEVEVDETWNLSALFPKQKSTYPGVPLQVVREP
jgi:hypothetical protein